MKPHNLVSLRNSSRVECKRMYSPLLMTKTLQRVKFQILVYLSDWTVTRDVNKNKLLGVRALDKKTQERKKDEK